jgi:adenosylmethionine-8-amino-7-oxononanoate aminotransferase
MQTAPAPLQAVSTQGGTITLADGRTLIDGVSSWWTAAHGYNHPHILEAMQRQLETMPHVMLGGLVHEPALTLASRLCGILPGNMARVFFSDSGSTAVEVALKMALQYWSQKGQQNRNRIACFHHGYHGDTMGAMSVSEPLDLHKAYRSPSLRNYQFDIPNDEYSFAEFAEMIEGVHKTVAAVIIEPLVQAAGGMRFHSPDTLAEIHAICKRHDILFIADEIATGFMRTGSLFACQEAGIAPDIICVGKALTGGAIGMAATAATQDVFDAFLSDDPECAFMHGPTYMGNPLACAAANASLDLFAREPYAARVEHIELHLQQTLEPLSGLRGVLDVRVKGAIGVVELEPERMDKHWFREQFIARGCWIRPLKNIIYLWPPLTIDDAQLTQLTDTVREVVNLWAQK